MSRFAELPDGRRLEFPDGTSVAPISQVNNATKESFDQEVLGKSASQMKAHWAKLSFSGRGSAPEELGSDSAIVSAVGSNIEAVGYVDSSAVNSSVKVVFKCTGLSRS